MSYTSENAKVLETYQDGDNLRVLLLRQFEDSGRIEYVIGSNFAIEDRGEHESQVYSWDWGHYFGDIVSAVDYWKTEVLDIAIREEDGAMEAKEAWVVEYPPEHYEDYPSKDEARAAYDSIELKGGEYKYLFIAHDDENGEFHPELDIGLAYESREKA